MGIPNKLDVVLCTKDNEDTLHAVLSRILKYVPLRRLIVIDGMSKDETVRIAERFQAEVYSDGGRGLGYARNMALRLVDSELFAFIDADAYIPQNWFSLVRHFKDEKVAAANGVVIFGYGNKPLQRLYEWMYKAGKEEVGFTNTILRRSAVLEVGGIREDLEAYEDRELYGRLRKCGYKWVSDPTVVALHPRTLSGHMRHARKWARGAGVCRVPAIYFLRPLLTSPFRGLTLAFSCHPLHLVFYPALRLSFLLGYLEGQRCR